MAQMDNLSMIKMDESVNISVHSWIVFSLLVGLPSSLSIGNSVTVPYNFAVTLSPNTSYVLIASLKNTTAHAWIYPLDTTGGIINAPVLDTTDLKDGSTFPLT